MANQKISLAVVSGLSEGRVYSDVDVCSKAVENELVDKNAIRQAVRNILTFRKGERVLYPEFGNGIYDSLFEKINSRTRSELHAAITEMLSDEPRISVTSISISPNIDNNEIDITVTYEIPTLSDTDSVTIDVAGSLV